MLKRQLTRADLVRVFCLAERSLIMPNSKDFQWDFRPETYWDNAKIGLANIKGEWRRRMVEGALRTGQIDVLVPSTLSDDLSHDERRYRGAMHPTLLGGEFLPEYLPDEVEIARLSLDSVTWDVYQVRAQASADGRIHYRVVDEYESWEQGLFSVSPESSEKPFTFGEMVSFIDNIEIGECEGHFTNGLRDGQYVQGEKLEELIDFVRVSSLYYPELESWYDAEALEWYSARLSKLGLEELD